VADWGDENGYIQSIKVYADDRWEGSGPSGLAFRAGQPYLCNDMLNDPATLPWRAEIERCGFRATAVFPIRVKDKVAGALNVYAGDPAFFSRQRNCSSHGSGKGYLLRSVSLYFLGTGLTDLELSDQRPRQYVRE
jgi:hypothetical protein